MRKVYVYRNNSGEIPVSGFIENTHKKIRSKFEFMLRYIKDENNPLCEPYVKHFTIDKYKMLYELRIRANGTMVRVIYYKAEENIILLHAFFKKSRRDTENALEYALKILNSFYDSALYPMEQLVEV